MATITESVADTSGFIPQAWALEALNVLRNNVVLARIVTMDKDYAPGWQGKTLNIPYPGTFTTQDKTAGNPITAQAPTGGASVALNLSKHKTVDMMVEDFAAAQSNSDLLNRYIQPAIIALAEQVENDLFSLYSSLTGTSVGTAGTDLTSTVVRTAAKNLDVALAPTQDRWLVISAKDKTALLGDTNLATFYAYSDPEAIKAGNLPNLYGFNVAMSQLVPAVAGTPVSTKNLAFHKSAIMMAMRPFMPITPGTGVATATAVDPESGIAIRVLKQYDINYRATHLAFDILYGFVALRPNQGLVALA